MQKDKFPGSDLSAAFIKDVSMSLERHKEKIAALTKELEQETLYVEYLERLLDEVQKSHDDDKNDPALPLCVTPTKENHLSMSEKNGLTDNKDTEEEQVRNKKKKKLFYFKMQIQVFWFISFANCNSINIFNIESYNDNK
jgi:hypothetical protein